MKTKTLISIILGSFLIGAVSVYFFFGGAANESVLESAADEPLYWVAPMDPNYRRDAPGKSPMGMDLIPVYDNSTLEQDQPGLIRISSAVENNLGVRTAKVSKKILDTVINTVGYIQYDEDKLIHVHPRVEGWVEKLYVKAEGERVREGKPLYSLYSPQLVNAQEEYLLALSRNNSSLLAASEARLLALQLAPAFIENLKKSKKVSQTIIFNAPQTGVVANLAIREGFYVKPGSTLMSVGSLAQVWVEAEVFARQAAFVQAGLTVEMTVDYIPGKTWHGQVDYVYPALSEQTRTLRIRLRFDNQQELLLPNMYAQIVIHGYDQQAVLAVPKEALIRTGMKNRVVLALGDGQFKSLEVTAGRITADSVEILSGLNEGDSIVTSAQFLLDSESSKTSDFLRMEGQSLPLPDDQTMEDAEGDGNHNHQGHVMSHDSGQEMQP